MNAQEIDQRDACKLRAIASKLELLAYALENGHSEERAQQIRLEIVGCTNQLMFLEERRP
jgi:uncharacterized protein HemY